MIYFSISAMQALSSSNPSCSPHVRVKISKWDNIQDAPSCHEFVQYWTSWTLVGSLSANDGCVMAINEWSEAVCISVSNVWAPSWCQESWCYEPILMLTRVTIKIRSEQLSYYDIFSLDSKYTKSALRRIQSERFVESKVSIIALFCCVSWCLVLVTCSHYWLAPYPPQVKREEVSKTLCELWRERDEEDLLILSYVSHHFFGVLLQIIRLILLTGPQTWKLLKFE